MPPDPQFVAAMTKNLSDEMQRNARQALAGLTASAQGDEVGGLPVQRLLSAFFRARYLVFGTTLFGILIGTFMAITTPNNYISTGKFLFTSSGAESRSLDPTQTKETSQETIATGAAYILNSDDLLMRVVRDLTPQRILQPYQPTGEGQNSAKEVFFKIQRDWNAVDESNMTEEEALKRLQKTIVVDRPRNTDVLIATCNANNPELAKDILSTYMEEAIEWHIEKYDDKAAYDAAKAAAEDGIHQHAKAQVAMREFLDRKAQVSSFDEHMQSIKIDEIEARSRVGKLKDDVIVKRESKLRWDARLADPERLPPTKTRKVRQSIATELGAELRKQLGDTMVELTGKRRTYRDPKHIEIVALENKIEDIKGSIQGLSKLGKKDTMVDEVYDNPQYLKAVESRDTLEFELVGVEATVKQAEALHKDKADELKRLQLLEPEFEVLRAEVLRTQQSKMSSSLNWETAQQKRALGLGKFSVLDSIQAASLPLEKEGPNRGKLLMGGMFVGLFLGLGLVVLRALPDRVVRTRDDLEEIEGLSVIGVMPRLDRANLRRHMAMREQGW